MQWQDGTGTFGAEAEGAATTGALDAEGATLGCGRGGAGDAVRRAQGGAAMRAVGTGTSRTGIVAGTSSLT